MASDALGHDQATVPSEDIEEREEEEVPLRRKRSVHRRARTEFNTSAFAQFPATLSADVLSQAAVSASAGPSGVADKGKAPMPDLDIPAEFLAEDAQARQRLEEEQASARTDLLGADVNEDNFIERMTAIKERKKRALAELRYRALKGKPLKQSEVTKMMRNLTTGKGSFIGAQYNLFRPKPAITEPPSKRQRVERASSQPSDVPAATTQPADDPDSAGGSSFHPAGSTPMSGFAVPEYYCGTLGTTGLAATVPISAAMDSSCFTSSVLAVLLNRPDDEVLAEILFRVSMFLVLCSGLWNKLPDDEIVDPRVKVEPISESTSSPPRSRSKHLGRSDTSLKSTATKLFYLKELLLMSIREDLPLYVRRDNRYFRLNPDVDVGLDLWRDVNLLCQSLHSDDVKRIVATQMNWGGEHLELLTVLPSYCRDVVVAGSVIRSFRMACGNPMMSCLCSIKFVASFDSAFIENMLFFDAVGPHLVSAACVAAAAYL
ncbi:hypothetical protein Tco_1236954 [Tanacetum coccineum]